MKNKFSRGLALFAAFSLAISVMPQASAATKVIKIGLIFPTSGAFSILGTDQSRGAELVLDWANANGGVGGAKIEILKGDSQSNAGVGATVAQRLIDQGAQILIGSYSSGISAAIMPVAQRNNVILWEVGAV